MSGLSTGDLNPIRTVPMLGTHNTPTLVVNDVGGTFASALAVDVAANQIFWWENATDTIYRSTLTGTGRVNLVTLTSAAIVPDIELFIPTSAPSSAPEIAVSGNSMDIADGDSTPDAADHNTFLNTLVGNASTRVFTIHNSGTATLNVSGITFTGTHGGSFNVTNLPPYAIPASGMQNVTVQFAPSSPAVHLATINIANDDANENLFNFDLQATAVAPEIAVSGNSVDIVDGDSTPDVADGTDFGSVATAGGTVVHTFTVSNPGSAQLNLTDTPIVVVSGAHASDFTITPPSASVAAGGNTTFDVTFNPSADGLRTATLSIANNDGNENPFNFSIRGTGTGPQTFDLAGNAVSNTPFDGGESYIFVTNSAPVISSNGGGAAGTQNVAENTTAVTTVTANDSDMPAQTLTYSITGGADMGLFSIVPGTGVLTFASAPDFETPADAGGNNVYEVTVTVTDFQALSVTVTNVNELPSFVKGADQLLPYNTSSAQTAVGWATSINDGDSTVTQALTFNISSNSNPGIFTTAPSINSSTGTLTYTPNGTAGTATIGVTLTDDNTINGNAALTTAEQTFTITVEAAPNYTVSTAGNVIVVTDLSGNGDTLAVSEPSAGDIQFAAAGRTFSVNGGLQIAGNSGALTRTSVTAITVNAAAGADTINVGAFTGTLPSLTINGGTGDDTVNLNGDITFATNASLDLDLQNDDVTPGVDIVSVTSNANILTSGTGTITVKVSRNVALASGSSLETVDGGITIDAHVNGTIAASFEGILLSEASIRTTGTGNIQLTGKSGLASATGGVIINSSSEVSSAGAGSITITGSGGSGVNFVEGVRINGSLVSVVDGDLWITGTGGVASGSFDSGVRNFGSQISSTGTGNIVIEGTAGSGTNEHYGISMGGNGASVTASASGTIETRKIG